MKTKVHQALVMLDEIAILAPELRLRKMMSNLGIFSHFRTVIEDDALLAEIRRQREELQARHEAGKADSGREFVRVCFVYCNPAADQAVVAAVSTQGGVMVEKPGGAKAVKFSDPSGLHETIRAALDVCEDKENFKPSRKWSGWPAYRASGCKTTKKFEADFIPLLIAGVNEVNDFYYVTTREFGEFGLQLTITFNAYRDDYGDAVRSLVQKFLAFRAVKFPPATKVSGGRSAKSSKKTFLQTAGKGRTERTSEQAASDEEASADEASPLNYDDAIMLDAEDLAEGGVAEAYKLVLPTLRKFVKKPAKIKEDVDRDAPRYAVRCGDVEFEIFGPNVEEEADSWGRATVALFAIVNEQLKKSSHRFYAINEGNDLCGMFLTPAEAKAAQRALPNKSDWPYLPKDEPPGYGWTPR